MSDEIITIEVRRIINGKVHCISKCISPVAIDYSNFDVVKSTIEYMRKEINQIENKNEHIPKTNRL